MPKRIDQAPKLPPSPEGPPPTPKKYTKGAVNPKLSQALANIVQLMTHEARKKDTSK